jgi:hypothetical protein
MSAETIDPTTTAPPVPAPPVPDPTPDSHGEGNGAPTNPGTSTVEGHGEGNTPVA